MLSLNRWDCEPHPPLNLSFRSVRSVIDPDKSRWPRWSNQQTVPRASKSPSRRPSLCRRVAARSAASARSSPPTRSPAPARCRCRSPRARAARASGRSSRCPTTRAPETARSASAGASRFPSITRKTDKGLPRYLDAEESDVFILSGAEDLVPVYRQDPDGTWVAAIPGTSGRRRVLGTRSIRPPGRSRGRTRRLPRPPLPAAHRGAVRPHRALEQDRLAERRPLALDLQGQHPHALWTRSESRIADPLDASRIFTWLICETRDDKGNAVLYRYKAEDGLGVDLGKAHERNRGPPNDVRRTANRYLKRIHYGNRTPLLDNAGVGRASWTKPRSTPRSERRLDVRGGVRLRRSRCRRARRQTTRGRGTTAPTRSPPTARASRSAPRASASAS